jgi:hypothetical protein
LREGFEVFKQHLADQQIILHGLGIEKHPDAGLKKQPVEAAKNPCDVRTLFGKKTFGHAGGSGSVGRLHHPKAIQNDGVLHHFGCGVSRAVFFRGHHLWLRLHRAVALAILLSSITIPVSPRHPVASWENDTVILLVSQFVASN